MAYQKATLASPFPWINTASFRFPVTLLEQTITTDVSGSVPAWAATDPAVTALCKIDFLRGDEIIKSGQDISQSFLKLTTWYDPAFSEKDRIQTEAEQVYVIQNIENVSGMGIYMVLTCERIGANS